MDRHIAVTALCVFIAASLSGCATSDPTIAETASQAASSSSQSLNPGGDVIDLTPYLQTQSNWRKCDDPNFCSGKEVLTDDPSDKDGKRTDIFTGMYARLRVSSVIYEPSTEDGVRPRNVEVRQRNYEEEERTMLERLFIGRNFSSVLSAKVRIVGDNPDQNFDHVFPLASVSHDSNSEVGEAFVTDVSHTRVDEPFFRVDPGMKIAVTFEYRQSEEISSNVVNSVLDVAREATELLAVQSTIITKLTNASAERQAKVFDQALGALFSEELTERVQWEHEMRDWPGPENAISVRFDKPREGNGSDTEFAGHWSVHISCLKPSIFSDWQYCPGIERELSDIDKSPDSLYRCRNCSHTVRGATWRAFREISPHMVLATKLSETTTIRDYLRSQDWFTEGIAAVAKESAAAVQGAAVAESAARDTVRFCSRIKSEMVHLGLNHRDAAVVLHSITNGLEFAAAERQMIIRACAFQLNPGEDLIELSPSERI